MSPTDWLGTFLGALAGGAAAAAAVAFLGRQWLTRLLDRQAERFKHQLAVDAKTRELLLRSQIEFKERQPAEFYGPIYAYLKRGRGRSTTSGAPGASTRSTTTCDASSRPRTTRS